MPLQAFLGLRPHLGAQQALAILLCFGAYQHALLLGHPTCTSERSKLEALPVALARVASEGGGGGLVSAHSFADAQGWAGGDLGFAPSGCMRAWQACLKVVVLKCIRSREVASASAPSCQGSVLWSILSTRSSLAVATGATNKPPPYLTELRLHKRPETDELAEVLVSLHKKSCELHNPLKNTLTDALLGVSLASLA